jgi:hypothetical protein
MIKKKVDRDLSRLDERAEIWDWKAGTRVYEIFRHGECLESLIQNVLFFVSIFLKKD